MVRGRGNESGFSLVEVLVSLAMLATILSLVASSSFTARQFISRKEEIASKPSRVVVANIIRRVIEASRHEDTVGLEPSSILRGAALIGRSDSLTVRSSFAPSGQYSGIYDYSIHVERSTDVRGDGRLLLTSKLARERNPSTEVEKSIVSQRVLLEGVTRSVWRYSGAADHNSAPHWSEDWSNTVNLPSLVFVAIYTIESKEEPWLELIVQLPLAQK